MGNLKINLKPMQNPFIEEIAAKYEIWCQINIVIESPLNDSIELWYLEWDINYFIAWFLRSYLIFSIDKFFLPKLEQESLAEINNRFTEHIMTLYDFDDPIDDRDYNQDESDKVELMSQSLLQLSEYFGDERSISVAFTGTITPHIIIGMNNGIGEISLVEKKKNVKWKYNFDMQQFIKDTLFEIRNALIEWKANYYNPDIKDEYEQLLNNVNMHIRSNGFE